MAFCLKLIQWASVLPEKRLLKKFPPFMELKVNFCIHWYLSQQTNPIDILQS
jgi:hypothetical protein